MPLWARWPHQTSIFQGFLGQLDICTNASILKAFKGDGFQLNYFSPQPLWHVSRIVLIWFDFPRTPTLCSFTSTTKDGDTGAFKTNLVTHPTKPLIAVARAGLFPGSGSDRYPLRFDEKQPWSTLLRAPPFRISQMSGTGPQGFGLVRD